MRLRQRLADEIDARARAHLPEALATVWDTGTTTVALEQVSFLSAGAEDVTGWERAVKLSGIAVMQLRGGAIDALPLEPMIADLTGDPIHLPYDPDATLNELSERVRFVLIELRDRIADGSVATTLRFTFEGAISRRISPAARPVGVGVSGEVQP